MLSETQIENSRIELKTDVIVELFIKASSHFKIFERANFIIGYFKNPRFLISAIFTHKMKLKILWPLC